jgi:hypothetical protein
MLVYPLQSAPLRKVPKEVLTELDKSIRRTVKGVIGLPKSTSTGFIYSHRKYRGLGVMRCEWEIFLQHFAIAKRLLSVPDELFHRVFDCTAEMTKCKEVLQVEGETTRQLRNQLRERAFSVEWKQTSFQSVGIEHFRSCPKANAFISNKGKLSESEWTAAIKLTTNYANLRGVPNKGVAGNPDRHCRHCPAMRETPSHVSGTCPFSDGRRNNRHNKVKRSVKALLEAKGFECIEEAACEDEDRRQRFIDILAFDPKERKAYLIDPTVRYESNRDVAEEVDVDKSGIYNSCIADLKRQYVHKGDREFTVVPLWFGARGSVCPQVEQFFEDFGLSKDAMLEIALDVMVDTGHMIHNHIYG